jgi:hypothetical protein
MMWYIVQHLCNVPTRPDRRGSLCRSLGRLLQKSFPDPSVLFRILKEKSLLRNSVSELSLSIRSLL